jgi:hypothetical protein
MVNVTVTSQRRGRLTTSNASNKRQHVRFWPITALRDGLFSTQSWHAVSNAITRRDELLPGLQAFYCFEKLAVEVLGFISFLVFHAALCLDEQVFGRDVLIQKSSDHKIIQTL